MRLAFVIPGGLEPVTGGYRYDRRLRDGLTDRGWSVDIHEIPARGYHRRLRTAASRTLLRELGDGEYDVILQDELGHPNLWLLNPRLRRRTDAPLVALVHLLRVCDPTIRDRLDVGRRYETRYLRGVDAYIFNSRATRRAAARLTDPYPGIVAYPGRSSELAPERPPDSADDELRIAYVGHLLPIKGLDLLLRGAAPVEAPWRLTVVGSSERNPRYGSRVESLADELEIAERVTFTGFLERPALTRVLDAADLLAMPARYEAFGMVYLEAMERGTAPLASTAGGASELVEDGRTGYLVEPEAVEEIAAVVRRLAADRSERERVGRAAARRARTHPSWQQTVADIDRFLRSLAASGR